MEVILRTSRLTLVPISRKYSNDIFKEFTSEVTTYMQPKPAEKIEETYSFIDSAVEKISRHEELQMVVLRTDTNEFLGCAGLHQIKTETPELGIWLKKSAQGQGYGKETIRALVEWAKENIKFRYLKYPVDKNNIPSVRIPESLGGVPGLEYQKTGLGGNSLNIIEYRIS